MNKKAIKGVFLALAIASLAACKKGATTTKSTTAKATTTSSKTTNSNKTTASSKTTTAKNTTTKHVHSLVQVEAKDATCTTEGYNAYEYCSNCDYTTKTTISALSHSYSSEFTVDNESTCINKGSKSRHCLNEGCSSTTEETEIDLTDHNYSNEYTIDVIASEENDGSKSRHCTICDEKTDITVIPALGHNLKEVNRSNPNCYNSGYINYKCSDEGCEYEVQVYQPKIEHQYEIVSTNEPTCTKGGADVLRCPLCFDYITVDNDVEPLGHNYEEDVDDFVEATCNSYSTTHYVCSRCSDHYAVEGTEYGEHDYDYDDSGDATCISYSYDRYVCSVCGDDYFNYGTEYGEHDYCYDDSGDATCQDYSWTKYVCSVCDDKYYEYGDEYADHEYSTKVDDIYPTCTKGGYEIWKCYWCSDTTKLNLTNAIGHTLDNGKCSNCDFVCDNHKLELDSVENEASCYEYGYCYYKCANCGEIEGRDIELIPHKYEKTNSQEATCSEYAYTEYECSVCHASTREFGEEYAPHTLTYLDGDDSTCEKAGGAYYYCSVCECGVSKMFLPLGHDFKNITTVDPTCSSYGYTVKTCSRCGAHDKDSETNIVPALAHTTTDEYFTMVPTCEEKGYTAKYCSVCEQYVDKKDFTDKLEHEFTICSTSYDSCQKSCDAICKNCSTIITIIIEEKHDYKAIYDFNPCETDGNVQYTCSICEDTYYEFAYQHPNRKLIEHVSGNCDEQGYDKFLCLDCNTEFEENYEYEHNYGLPKTILGNCYNMTKYEYTCSTCGALHYEYAECHNYTRIINSQDKDCCYIYNEYIDICVDCGIYNYIYTQEEIGIHNYKEIEIKGTCSIKSIMVNFCLDCKYTEFIKELDTFGDHNYFTDAYDAPTCTEEGSIYKICEICGNETNETLPATGHNLKLIEEQAVTCTTDGYKSYECSGCYYPFIEITDNAEGHDMVDGVCSKCGVLMCTDTHSYKLTAVIEYATCTTDGKGTYTCEICGVTTTDYIPAGHNYKLSYIFKPGCTNFGYKCYECMGCEDDYEDDIYPLGHTFVDGKCIICNQIECSTHDFYVSYYIDSPECESEGLGLLECRNCSHFITEVLPATEHDWDLLDTITAATCTTDGVGEYYCTNCGITKDDVILATNHNYFVTDGYEATCLDDGTGYLVCHKCGDKKDNDIKALGHNYVDIKYDPSCEDDGYEAKECTRCGEEIDIKNIVPALKHNYIETEVLPTCLEEGFIAKVCSNCGDSYDKTDIVPALGHKFKITAAYEAYDFEETGEYTYTLTCSKCDLDIYVELNPDAFCKHDWTENGRDTLEGICLEGYIYYECSNCNESKEESYNTHDYVDVTPDGEGDGNCDTEGYKYYKCSTCDDEITVFTGYTHDLVECVVEGNCEDLGMIIEYCPTCEFIEIIVLTYLGSHVYVATDHEDATCDDLGYTEYICTICGDTDFVDGDEYAPHSINYDCLIDTVEATCTEGGYSIYQCDYCNKEFKADITEPLKHNYEDGYCTRCGEEEE